MPIANYPERRFNAKKLKQKGGEKATGPEAMVKIH